METKISVVIPVPPGEHANLALDSLKSIDYPQEKVEILVVEGKQPSRQRNQAAQEAKGDIIYFLDSDSIANGNLFRQTIEAYRNLQVVGVGGPSLTPSGDSYLQKAFGFVLGSWFGCFSTRCRFASIGEIREGTERSFILCNFSIKREIFIKEDGFNEELYPNEENEFVNRLRAKGYRLIYHPGAKVYKSMRPSLSKFARQIFSYGRGRMEHSLTSPFIANLIYLIPLVFCLYLFALFFYRTNIFMVPLYLYLGLNLGSSALISLNNKKSSLLLVLPFLFFIEHLAYGLGLIWGLAKRILRLSKANQDEIKVVKVQKFCGEREISQLVSGRSTETDSLFLKGDRKDEI